MSERMEFPSFSRDSEEFSSVSGHVDAGSQVMDRIHDKAIRYRIEYGRDAKYVILDSQSYLDLYAYFHIIAGRRLGRGYNSINFTDPLEIQTSAGLLTPIVLPQTKKRIQLN